MVVLGVPVEHPPWVTWEMGARVTHSLPKMRPVLSPEHPLAAGAAEFR